MSWTSSCTHFMYLLIHSISIFPASVLHSLFSHCLSSTSVEDFFLSSVLSDVQTILPVLFDYFHQWSLYFKFFPYNYVSNLSLLGSYQKSITIEFNLAIILNLKFNYIKKPWLEVGKALQGLLCHRLSK